MKIRLIKNLAWCFLSSLFVFLFSSSAYSQPLPEIVVHVNDDYKIAELAGTVIQLRNAYPGAEVRVVVIGKAVTRLLKTRTDAVEMVNVIRDHNVSIGLCHNAINNHKVDPKMLVEGVNILKEAGNLTIMKLRARGYHYIKL